MTPYEHTVFSNALQKYFIENTRLGIPVIFHEECLHGFVANQATSFPHPIALAGTFNETYVLNGLQTEFEANMRHYEQGGDETTYPHHI